MPAIALETAKSFLGVSGDASDAQIALLIEAATGDLESMTSTRLLTTEVIVQAGSFAELEHLSVGPVTGIVEIAYEDASGRHVLPVASAKLTGQELERGVAVSKPPAAVAVEVKLTVGYGATESDIPANLRWALLALVRGKFDDRAVDIDPLIVNHRIWG